MVIAVMLKMVIRLYLQVDAGDDAGINHPDVVAVAAVPVAEPSQGNYQSSYLEGHKFLLHLHCRFVLCKDQYISNIPPKNIGNFHIFCPSF